MPDVPALDRLFRAWAGLPAPLTGWTVETVAVPLPDGAVLAGEHWAPADGANRGTVMVRTPYHRGFPYDLFHGRWMAEQGYHVLVLSVRGTNGSTGTFRPFADEAADGRASVAWLRDQPWFDGRLASIGGSYLGWTQWALLDEAPPEMRACVIVTAPHDFARAIRPHGMFTWHDSFVWTNLMATQRPDEPLRNTARLLGAPWLRRRVLRARPMWPAAERVLGGGGPWLRTWMDTPDLRDPAWHGYRAEGVFGRGTSAAVLLVGGWQDMFLTQTVEQYRRLRAVGVDTELLVGPWTHTDAFLAAGPSILRRTLGWLETHLAAGAGPACTGVGERSRVQVAVTGGRRVRWQDLPDWPPPQRHQGDHASGRSSAVVATRLVTLHPASQGRLAHARAAGGATAFVMDPADPTPSVGGRVLSLLAGSRDNRRVERRADVVTWTSGPLADDVLVLGPPEVELVVEADPPGADLHVRLCDVTPAGVSRNVSAGGTVLDAPGSRPVHARPAMDPCAHRFRAGHRIRLQVAAAAHPRYAVGDGLVSPASTAALDTPVAVAVHHAGSRLGLPLSVSE